MTHGSCSGLGHERGDGTVQVRCTNTCKLFAKAKPLEAGTEGALLLGRPGAVLCMLVSGLSNSNDN